MSAIDDTPVNHNFLSPLNFTFNIKRAPNVNFFIQEANVPSISLPSADVPTPLVKIPKPGEHLTYGDLKIKFKVDEDLTNYLEIFNWITDLGKPDSYYQYKSLETNDSMSGNGIVSDISLILLSNIKNPNIEIIYRDAWPTFIGDLEFDVKDTTINYLPVTATFKYVDYKIQKVT